MYAFKNIDETGYYKYSTDLKNYLPLAKYFAYVLRKRGFENKEL